MNSNQNFTMVENKEMKSNNLIVVNMEELTKRLKKEEKVLQQLEKNKADASVITVQEQIVSQLRTQQDISMKVVLGGILIIAVLIWLLPEIPVSFFCCIFAL